MPTETRYMRSDMHTINGLSAYKLGTAQTLTGTLSSKTELGLLTCYWGIRVWKRASDGTETEITSGTPVAQVSRSVNGYGLQSNTWSCPQTSLESTDSVVVRVYTKLGSGAWQLCAEFITEQLSAESLDSATWTVNFYTRRATYNDGENDWTTSSFWWGTSTYNSRLEGFAWTQQQGQLYEISVDAVAESSLMLAPQCVFNVCKEADVASHGLHASEAVFNLAREAVAEAFGEVEISTKTEVTRLFLVFGDFLFDFHSGCFKPFLCLGSVGFGCGVNRVFLVLDCLAVQLGR